MENLDIGEQVRDTTDAVELTTRPNDPPMKPLVSIILPAYNAAAHIQKAIDSVLTQTYTNWELLAVNDGSTDSTLDLLESFSDPRIQVFTHQNQGVSATRNLALRHATGDFFTFLDADDTLPPSCLEAYVEHAISNPRTDIFAGKVRVSEERSGRVLRQWESDFQGNPLSRFVRLSERVFFGVCLFLRSRDQKTYFRSGLTHCEDLLFFIDYASQHETNYLGIPSLTYEQMVVSDSAMSDLRGLEAGYRQLYEAVCSIKNPCISRADRAYLRMRYTRIMILSYLNAGMYRAALNALFHFLHLKR